MASKIRTALLSTAVASGLLLSNAPAYAAPIVGDSTALETKIETTEPAHDAGSTDDVPLAQEPAPPAPVKSPEHVAPESDPLSQDAPPAGDIVDADEQTPVVVDDSVNAENDDASNESSSSSAELDQAAQPSTGEDLAQNAENADAQTTASTDESATDSSDTGATPENGNADTTNTPAGTDASLAPATSESPVPTATESSDEADDGTESGSDAEIDAMLTFDEFFEGLEMPPGSENWTEEQWLEFMETEEGQGFTDAVLEGLLDTEEFNDIVDIVIDFMDTQEDVYLKELKDYLLDLFGGNEEWAMEAYNGMAAELRAQGFDVADWTKDQAEAETTPPVKPKPEIKPEIKPAGNIKPVVDKKPVVEAVVKPVVQAKKDQLAVTGTDGTLLMGGAGVLLVGGGVLALGLRRKTRKH
ncbi:hypothetical protein CQ018_16240 [Arthrobacter sp. MYb227]|uniref:hypothetical protein n=1 Tax=Arthrobacter sp. MYb227 TaxID=1848601 RepID=UPI000CFD9459|nr:hypothetical protein [Arthrobacter sp. MYb227]PQZ89093.1 hypothetical protein CQ018_16240 [Arthrobacter sp. MYb227]